MTRKTLEQGKLRQSLVSTTGRMWKQHEWKEREIKETKKYTFLYHGFDNGPLFTVTDKETKIEYTVSAYENKWIEGDKICWGVYI